MDETKIGKRKYHKGRHVEGAWLVGLIEDGSEDFRLELCPNNERTAEVLHGIIEQHVKVYLMFFAERCFCRCGGSWACRADRRPPLRYGRRARSEHDRSEARPS